MLFPPFQLSDSLWEGGLDWVASRRRGSTSSSTAGRCARREGWGEARMAREGHARALRRAQPGQVRRVAHHRDGSLMAPVGSSSLGSAGPPPRAGGSPVCGVVGRLACGSSRGSAAGAVRSPGPTSRRVVPGLRRRVDHPASECRPRRLDPRRGRGTPSWVAREIGTRAARGECHAHAPAGSSSARRAGHWPPRVQQLRSHLAGA